MIYLLASNVEWGLYLLDMAVEIGGEKGEYNGKINSSGSEKNVCNLLFVERHLSSAVVSTFLL